MLKIGKLVVEPLPAPRGELPPEESLQPLDVDNVVALLSENGPFADKLERYESRDGQLAMTRAVVEAFNNSSHLMVEAGTGTGKSLAYLIPAISWAMLNKTPVVVSTNTKNLQSQLFEKDLPLIKRVLGSEFRVALIKGRSNYVCLRKLVEMLEHADYEIRPSERGAVERIVGWVQNTRCGDLAELGAYGGAVRRVASSLTSTSEECAGRGCRYFQQCFLRRARAKAMAADVVVANHSLVFSEMGVKGQSLPPYNHLILDEAHNVEDAATRHFSVELSAGGFRFPLRRLGHTGGGARKRGHGLLANIMRQITDGKISNSNAEQEHLRKLCRNVSRAVSGVDKKLEPFFDALAALLRKRTGEARRLTKADQTAPEWQGVLASEGDLRSAIGALKEAIGALCDALRDVDERENLGFGSDFVRDLDAQRGMLAELCEQMGFVLAVDDAAYVYWVERDGRMRDSARAWAAPVAIGERLRDELYELKLAVVFTSATLSANGSFGFLQERLGLTLVPQERLRTLDVGSPFEHGEQCLMLVPMFLPEPGSEGGEYVVALGEFLAELFKRTNGRGLTLFTSYAMLSKTTKLLRDRLECNQIDVLAQGEDASREVLTEEFRHNYSSVLMGTHSFWEGVDVVGESLSCVVLARLPFSVFTEPIVAARCERIEAEGGNPFLKYAIPTAVIKFRQGFGRLIRHRADRGVVIVADRRIASKRYGHWFRRSVPVTLRKFFDAESMVDAVEEFLNS